MAKTCNDPVLHGPTKSNRSGDDSLKAEREQSWAAGSASPPVTENVSSGQKADYDFFVAQREVQMGDQHSSATSKSRRQVQQKKRQSPRAMKQQKKRQYRKKTTGNTKPRLTLTEQVEEVKPRQISRKRPLANRCELSEVRVDKLHDALELAFEALNQKAVKKLCQMWIKILEPTKQSKYPYNGGKDDAAKIHDEYDPENHGKNTAPPWWPNQEGYRSAKGDACRHKEPDHLTKHERVFLAIHLLRICPSKTIEEGIQKVMTGNADMDAFPPMASSIIEGLLSARRAEVEWEQGMRDGDSTVTMLLATRKREQTRKRKAGRSKQAMSTLEGAAMPDAIKIDHQSPSQFATSSPQHLSISINGEPQDDTEADGDSEPYTTSRISPDTSFGNLSMDSDISTMASPLSAESVMYFDSGAVQHGLPVCSTDEQYHVGDRASLAQPTTYQPCFDPAYSLETTAPRSGSHRNRQLVAQAFPSMTGEMRNKRKREAWSSAGISRLVGFDDSTMWHTTFEPMSTAASACSGPTAFSPSNTPVSSAESSNTDTKAITGISHGYLLDPSWYVTQYDQPQTTNQACLELAPATFVPGSHALDNSMFNFDTFAGGFKSQYMSQPREWSTSRQHRNSALPAGAR